MPTVYSDFNCLRIIIDRPVDINFVNCPSVNFNILNYTYIQQAASKSFLNNRHVENLSPVCQIYNVSNALQPAGRTSVRPRFTEQSLQKISASDFQLHFICISSKQESKCLPVVPHINCKYSEPEQVQSSTQSLDKWILDYTLLLTVFSLSQKTNVSQLASQLVSYED